MSRWRSVGGDDHLRWRRALRRVRPLVTGRSTRERRRSRSRPPQHGAGRRLLKLLVEIDSSRFLGNRVVAAVALVAILAIFAGLGYVVPAVLSQYF